MPLPITKPKTKRNNPMLKGVTADAAQTPVWFRASSVKTVELRDANGKVVGISFPSKDTDKANVTSWASKANRTSDTNIIPDYTAGAKNDPTRFRPSPWAGQRRPFYVHAHANPNRFAVTVKTVSRTGVVTRQKVRIDGATHGQLLAGNAHFQRASGKRQPRPVVYLSCSSGAPLGTAASGSAAFLHGEQNRATVYAPTGAGVRPGTAPLENSSYYGVRKPAGGPGEFTAFPPTH